METGSREGWAEAWYGARRPRAGAEPSGLGSAPARSQTPGPGSPFATVDTSWCSTTLDTQLRQTTSQNQALQATIAEAKQCYQDARFDEAITRALPPGEGRWLMVTDPPPRPASLKHADDAGAADVVGGGEELVAA